MEKTVNIIGAGLAGSEAALRLASLGFSVRLFEMRPGRQTPVHTGGLCAELVCSNSLKSFNAGSAAGMLKRELEVLGSPVFAAALRNRVPAGGSLAVNRTDFAADVTGSVERDPKIRLVRAEVSGIAPDGDVLVEGRSAGLPADAAIVASGPLTGDALASSIAGWTGCGSLAFYDAAAPIVMADSLDFSKLFRQSRYDTGGAGDYLNAPMDRATYEAFIRELVDAERVILRDFESSDLFQACQPIEEIARKGPDAPRFGPLKPVGLTDPATGRRPWAALQLRAEDACGQSYNLVGFQTNLRFAEQRRVFSLIPGLEHAEFARYGVMHRNTFVDAPKLLDSNLLLHAPRDAGASAFRVPVYFAGQITGTEGYCEAIRSGAHAALCAAARLSGIDAPALPSESAFGALMAYATSPDTRGYQPMHVNFGIMEPLDERIRNKRERYAAYAERGARAFDAYAVRLRGLGLLADRGD